MPTRNSTIFDRHDLAGQLIAAVVDQGDNLPRFRCVKLFGDIRFVEGDFGLFIPDPIRLFGFKAKGFRLPGRHPDQRGLEALDQLARMLHS